MSYGLAPLRVFWGMMYGIFVIKSAQSELASEPKAKRPQSTLVRPHSPNLHWILVLSLWSRRR